MKQEELGERVKLYNLENSVIESSACCVLAKVLKILKSRA